MFSMLKFKSPVIRISFMPVSTARYREFAIDEKHAESELSGL